MKKIIAILLILLLTGCSTQFGERISKAIAIAQNFTVTQTQVDVARNSYDGLVLVPLVKYASLQRCKLNQKFSLNVPCHDRKLLKKIREVDKQVDAAFVDTQTRINSGDNEGALAAYNTLISIIDVAKSLINQTGVSLLGV